MCGETVLIVQYYSNFMRMFNFKSCSDFIKLSNKYIEGFGRLGMQAHGFVLTIYKP